MSDCYKPSTSIFKDYISCNSETIKVNAWLTPNKLYTVRIIDYHGNRYDISRTTDDSGHFTIPVSALPDGFLNPHSVGFAISIIDPQQPDTLVKIPLLSRHDGLWIEVKSGTFEKAEIGASGVVESGGGSGGGGLTLTQVLDALKDGFVMETDGGVEKTLKLIEYAPGLFSIGIV